MATYFSPYILNQFQSIVMFDKKGFYVSASGVIQGHHGPLVFFSYCPLLIFNLNFCPGHNFQTIKGIKLELHTLIQHIIGKCNALEP